jgi:hypothetical protein
LNSERSPIIDPGVGYTVVADEYYDAVLHPTCSNFNFLSRLYISKFLVSVTRSGSVLEIGAGDSSAAPILSAANCALNRLTLSDVSASMLAHSQSWQEKGVQLALGDAEQLDQWAPKVDCIVAGLGDPYNTSRFWRQVASTLLPSGHAIFTTPSFEWASRYRGSNVSDKSAAEFVTRNGGHLRMPSYVPPLGVQVAMMEDAGLVLLGFEAFGIDHLAGQSISPKLRLDVPESLLWGFLAVKPHLPSSIERQRWRPTPVQIASDARYPEPSAK